MKMPVIGYGNLFGKFAGISAFKGEVLDRRKKDYLLVHIETEEGKATLLSEKAIFDKCLDGVLLGDAIIATYSEISLDNGDMLYVLEKVVALKNEKT
jgi:hypothetical protein